MDEIIKSVNNAAARTRAAWLSMLSLGTYLAVAVGPTTDRDFLLLSPLPCHGSSRFADWCHGLAERGPLRNPAG